MEFFNLELGNDVAIFSSLKAWERAFLRSKTFEEADMHASVAIPLERPNPIKGPGASVQNPRGLR